MLKRFFKYEDDGDQGGGATSAPPVAESTPAGGEGTTVNTDWGAMADDSDVSTPEVSAPAVEPSAPAPAPAAPIPEAQPPASVAAEPAQATQPQPQAQVEPPAQAAPAQRTPEEIAVLRQNYANELEQYYQLRPEDVMALATEPEKVLPRLAASVHLEVLDAISAQLPQRVGTMITQILESRQRESSAEDEFFKPFPDLKAYRNQVLSVGRMYRAANPTASKEQAIKDIGNFVRTSLGISAPSAYAAPAQVVPNNPFTPATGSGGGAVPQQASIWDEMITDDD